MRAERRVAIVVVKGVTVRAVAAVTGRHSGHPAVADIHASVVVGAVVLGREPRRDADEDQEEEQVEPGHGGAEKKRSPESAQ